MDIRTTRRRGAVAAASAGLLALTLTACGADTEGSASGASAEVDGFPLTITNCGEEVTFDAPPQRVVMLKSGAATYLHELDVLDRVVARAGTYPRDYYDAETWEAIEAVPVLTDEVDSAGHLQISQEVVLSQRPDLVLGASDNLTRETLAASGIPLLEEPALCPEPAADPSLDDIAEQLRTYGRVFGVPERGEAAAADATARVEAATGTGTGQPRTAAVLYPTVGGGTTYAYGTRSMAHPQLEAAGLRNVFADVDERVFEISREELLGRDPDVLVLLHSDGDPAAVEEVITSMRGAEALTAVRNGDIVVQLLNFSEPASPLVIDGLDRISEAFAR
ncbi:ABC transporter substrate-binding protein [Nocardioides sp. zg-DK7169]|uniref:ABC transporter substrate-binding protein n=1 Tax=Nocardioides sp. zg-DK7169 TaxID=2736600 RepID=UPI001554ECFA|nr:ABC transporter substrate-binding protein [Nocardioides sp. zg-DK7169]NPC96499.1 ABC transporter substrate-binding protein [Nocardioides sp. zg-DK7169]